MWTYEKRLQYPVKITQTCPKTAQLIISQFGGPDGELAASMRYLSQRYTMPCKEVAGLLYIHPQYLSRLFKKELGVTFGEYLNRFRIEKAKELLLQTNMPIYVVATECGFTDAAYFCKKFHQIMATTPLRYRKNAL